MSKRSFDPKDAIELAYKGLSNYAIADSLEVDESSVRRAFRAENFSRQFIPTNLGPRFEFELDEPIQVYGDCMITADWHIPLFDPDYANTMIWYAQEQRLKTLVIGGDFFNFDSLSQYDPKQTDAGLERELEEGIAVMGTLLSTFDRIVFLWGNHDARMHKALGYKIRFKSAMELVFSALGRDERDKIEFSNLDHCWVNANGKRYYVCHPASYTRVPLSTARTIAMKVNANVIVAHSHHSAVGYAMDGTTVVAEAGGLFDKTKTAYLQRTTTYPTWSQGFAYLDGGQLRVHSPGWSLV